MIGSRGTVPTSEDATVSFLVDNKLLFECPSEIVQAFQSYHDCSQPLNIGTGKEISIKQLVNYISKAVNYEGEVLWNTDKPDGQMKKLLDTSRMKDFVQITPIDVEEGIKHTVQWYKAHKEEADAKK